MIWFVGAGPGAEDLITVRGQKLLEQADLVIYAGSLVNPGLLKNCRKDCEIYNSAYLTLEQVTELFARADREAKDVVRLHTGDPSLYGAIREQMDWLDAAGIAYQICPGVSSFCGAAAALGAEYTLPQVSQSVVITRMAGRTSVPERESVRSFAAHQATMILFLSTGLLEELTAELVAGGYREDTPAAIVYKATWPEEKICRCRVGTLARTARENGITKTALIVVGDVLEKRGARSELYHPGFATEYRPAQIVREPETGRDVSSVPEAPAAPGRTVCAGAEAPQGSESKRCPESGRRSAAGRLQVIGIGPGSENYLTKEAAAALESCQVIAGYTVYVDLLRERYPGKRFLVTPMRQEELRCRMAFEEAKEGYDVAMVCSGDAGVYGMAGLIWQLSPEYPEIDIRILPGITAALAGGAVLGAPLMHDFAVISLSDLLTPWEKIEERLLEAARGDFVICLYNPSSKKRKDYLQKACDLLLRFKAPETVCGIVRQIGREGEVFEIMSLQEVRNKKVDMFTTVFIGNRETMELNGKMVTPRGYRNV